MARNHHQVIDHYRNTLVELEALGLRSYVMDAYFHHRISTATGYSLVTVRKIIDKYEKTKDYNCFKKFLNTIPDVYDNIKHSLIHSMIHANICSTQKTP